MAYNKEELDYLAAKILPVVVQQLEQSAQGVGDVEMATTLEGVFSLPAIKKMGGTERVVLVPLTELKGETPTLADFTPEEIAELQEPAVEAIESIKVVEEKVVDIAAHPNIIKEDYWYQWDYDLQKYVNLNIIAKGGVELPTFDIDTDTGELIMTQDSNISQVNFELKGDNLILKI